MLEWTLDMKITQKNILNDDISKILLDNDSPKYPSYTTTILSYDTSSVDILTASSCSYFDEDKYEDDGDSSNVHKLFSSSLSS